MAQDPKAVSRCVPNGEYQKLGTRAIPKDGPMKGLDAPRYGSARNTSKDYTNPKKK